MTSQTQTKMTDEQIDSELCRRTDSLDARLMNRSLTQREYDAEIKKLDRWAERQWSRC